MKEGTREYVALVGNCTSYRQVYWDHEDRDSIISYRICGVCRRSRPDWMKFHGYMNNGKDR